MKRGAANLLAGRAIVRNLFPLTAAEMGFSVPTEQLLHFGGMPLSVNAPNEEAREDFLRAYVTTYLAEEIRAEGLVRDLGSFHRFLEVASLVQVRRRTSQESRATQRYRATPCVVTSRSWSTHSSAWLPSYRLRSKVKEVALPKFYWFDPVVLHAAAGGFDQPLPGDWEGVLLEHFVLHEIRSHLHYQGVKGSLGYWATPSGSEVDFVWWHGRNVVAIEGEKRPRVPARMESGIHALRTGTAARAFIVYRGDRELEPDGTRVLPLETFLQLLHAGEIVG